MDTQKLLAEFGVTKDSESTSHMFYNLPSHPSTRLMVASNLMRVAGQEQLLAIPDADEVTTALTVFWLTRVLQNKLSHFVAYGAGINQYLPPRLWNHPDLKKLHKIAMVVKATATMPAIAYHIRGYSPAGKRLEFKSTTDKQTLLAEDCYRCMAKHTTQSDVILASTTIQITAEGMIVGYIGTPATSQFLARSEKGEIRDLFVIPSPNTVLSQDADPDRWAHRIAMQHYPLFMKLTGQEINTFQNRFSIKAR